MTMPCCSDPQLCTVSRSRKLATLPNAPAYKTSQGSLSPPLVLGHERPKLSTSDSFRSPHTPNTTTKSSDHMMALLQRILEEQSQLRQILQDNQQELVPKLDNISASVTAFCVKQPQTPLLYTNGVDGESAQVAHELAPAENCLAGACQGKTDYQNLDEQGKAEGKASAVRDSINKFRSKPELQRSLLARILTSTQFELGIGLVILLNMCTMFANLQLKGLHEGWKLGLRDYDADWDRHEARFNIIEHFFNTVYVAELVMRLSVLGRRFPKQMFNVIDAAIVTFGCLDAYVLPPMNIQAINISVLRLLSLSRLLRLGKFLRSSAHFHELRVLIRTLCVAIRGIFWSCMLLSGMIVAGGILMTQLAINLLGDESIDLDRRIWLYRHFGTTVAAVYTMFESTFTTAWILYARPLIEEVGYFFAIFWALWVVLVNFTTMRVVSALFLKETMSVGARDAENCAMVQLKRKGELAECLRVIFTEADTSRDGAISQDEFDHMMTNHDVIDSFAVMGLDTDEVGAFFAVLSADDGFADYNEFITGALAMASSAPSLDRMKSLQNQMKIEQHVEENCIFLRKLCDHFKIDLGPRLSKLT